MSQSGANVSQECITAFNELKLNKKYKYIIYKLSDDYKEIVVEEASDDKDWDNFREKLNSATSKSKSVRFSNRGRISCLDVGTGLEFN
jgi:cofilin